MALPLQPREKADRPGTGGKAAKGEADVDKIGHRGSPAW
jgi:hypothetical protein